MQGRTTEGGMKREYPSHVDFFICHASEDKSSFVRDLADQLLRVGASIFYDEYSIGLGQSLTASINAGMSRASHVVVVLSESFFEKAWTNSELQAAFNLHVSGDTRLVPIFHGIDPAVIRKRYPLVADIKGLSSSLGYEKVASELIRGAGIAAKISYLRIPADPNWKPGEDEPGWSIFCGAFSFPFRPFRDSSKWPKTIVEYGLPDDPCGRMRIILLQSTHLCFEVVDLDLRIVRAARDISSWLPQEPHCIVTTLSRQPCTARLLLDGDVADQVSCDGLRLPSAFLGRTGGVIGGSVDLDSFCPFRLGGLALYRDALTVEQARSIQKAFQEQTAQAPGDAGSHGQPIA